MENVTAMSTGSVNRKKEGSILVVDDEHLVRKPCPAI